MRMRRSRSFCRKSRLEWQYHHRINPDVSAAPAASANLGCASRRSLAWPRVSRAAACSLGMRDAEPSKVGEPTATVPEMTPPRPARRFPPPWSAEETDACFIVRDHNGQALAYVHFEEEPDGAQRPSSSPATRARRTLLPMLLSWRTSCEAPPDADPRWGKSLFSK